MASEVERIITDHKRSNADTLGQDDIIYVDTLILAKAIEQYVQDRIIKERGMAVECCERNHKIAVIKARIESRIETYKKYVRVYELLYQQNP